MAPPDQPCVFSGVGGLPYCSSPSHGAFSPYGVSQFPLPEEHTPGNQSTEYSENDAKVVHGPKILKGRLTTCLLVSPPPIASKRAVTAFQLRL
jgi:hypothetical protein